MKVFKPISRQFTPRVAADATLSLPANENEAQPTEVDTHVVEMYDDDGWKEWQDSVFVDEFTNEAIQTVPGKLE